MPDQRDSTIFPQQLWLKVSGICVVEAVVLCVRNELMAGLPRVNVPVRVLHQELMALLLVLFPERSN